MKILILGSQGMLGHMVLSYLKSLGIFIFTNKHRFPSQQFIEEVITFDGDAIINCIGSIPQRSNNFEINYELPIWLNENVKCKVIHPHTDCFDNLKDSYAVSKMRSFNYLMDKSKSTKIIQCSIIGPEKYNKKSLLEWFLECNDCSVKGYNKALWNGITTLEWCKLCIDLIKNWDKYTNNTIPYSDSVSKFELLCIIKKVFNKNIAVTSCEEGIDRRLNGNLKTKNIELQLIELKNYMDSDFYKNSLIL